MSALTPALYNELERRALSSAFDNQRELFLDGHESSAASLARIQELADIQKYFDLGATHSLDYYFNNILAGIDPEEFDLHQKILGALSDFSESFFGKVLVAQLQPLAALNILRHINYIIPDRTSSILDFQAGCGYLALLAHFKNYKYAGIETRQAFYIYQNQLWSFVAKERLSEAALVEFQTEEQFCHLPWWETSKPLERQSASFDIFVISEPPWRLGPKMLGMALDLAARAEVVLFDSWGCAKPQTRAEITIAFAERNFLPTLEDSVISVFEKRCRNGHSKNAASSILTAREKHSEEKFIPLEHLQTLFTLLLGKDYLEPEQNRGFINPPKQDPLSLLLS